MFFPNQQQNFLRQIWLANRSELEESFEKSDRKRAEGQRIRGYNRAYEDYAPEKEAATPMEKEALRLESIERQRIAMRQIRRYFRREVWAHILFNLIVPAAGVALVAAIVLLLRSPGQFVYLFLPLAVWLVLVLVYITVSTANSAKILKGFYAYGYWEHIGVMMDSRELLPREINQKLKFY